MYTPPEAFIFRWKNKTGVTSTLGPHRPHQHYKTKVPRVQNVKLEHSQARIELQEEKQKTKNKTEHTVRGPRLPLASPRTLGPFGQSPVPGRSGDGPGFHPSLRIHGLLFQVPSLGVCHRLTGPLWCRGPSLTGQDCNFLFCIVL